ncbi:MAG: hypothetical protein DWP98_02815 [Bacteroidetes bacterium]|nr:MAG: hypothetical protein DWP98_02815 [Bacteroidota bacterium]MBL1145572.1 hypothetical protein [Bacteroidota bacterium]MCB0801554.1 hypothetical protein [Flavobacteriales bacterium]NOG58368.1 hypothetical protein [Bacteroidota bacterium]
MFTKIFGKKKLKEDKLSNIFVNATLQAVEESFTDIVGLIKESPEFIVSPNIDPSDDSKFMLIVIAANLKEIPKYLPAHQDNRVINSIITKLSGVFDVSFDKLEGILRDYQSYLSRVNLPSNNNLYAMSKALFYKYELGQYQEEYFKNMNSPNPLFLKRLDEAMALFLFNWASTKENYQIVE